MYEDFTTSPNAELVLKELFQRYPRLRVCEYDIRRATSAIIHTFALGGSLLTCGNGGSSSDSVHIAGELMKSFEQKRPLRRELKERLESFGEEGKYLSMKLQDGLPVIPLTANEALITAVANDTDPALIYAQQVIAYATGEGDSLLAISTSGNSQNIINAIIAAKATGYVTIGLTGESGGKMKELCEIMIRVPETRTSFVQELHLPVYHAICMIIEDYFIHFPKRMS